MIEVKDYLLKYNDDAEALTAAQPWVTIVEGQPQLKTPTWQSAMNLTAYTNLGTPGEYDEEGNETVASIAPTQDTYTWWILTLPKDEQLPETLQGFVQTEGLRSQGLPMPEGVVGFASMIAGVKIN